MRRSALVILLRLFGTSSLAALVFVAAPREWMRDIHAALGMGAMPESPVVWYLARSTSAFYALMGGLFWLLSFDPVRYRPILRYLGAVIMLFGVALFAIDWTEGMPVVWTFWEGPVMAVYGGLMFVLSAADGSPAASG